MYSFRKSNKGLTLVELMFVVIIIGVLSLLGLRLYSGQQAKAKEAIVKANAATFHTLILFNMADTDYVGGTPNTRTIAAVADIDNGAGCRNPFTDLTGNINVMWASGLVPGNPHPGIQFRGRVYIVSPSDNSFYLHSLDGDGSWFGDVLIAEK